MKKGNAGMEELFSTLAHPKRRAILLDLFYEGEGTVKHFKQDYNLKTGTLYHHLNILKNHGLIEQNDQRGYKLTERGINFVEPLFKDDSKEYDEQRQTLQIKNGLASTHKGLKNHQGSLNGSFYTYTDKLVTILFEKAKITLVVMSILFVLMGTILSMNQLGIIGHHYIEAGSKEIALLTVLLTLLLALILLAGYPKILKKAEPITLEFFALGIGLFIPTVIFATLLEILILMNQQTLITKEIMLVIEFITQMYWVGWSYVIFRKINGIDYIKSLLGAFIVNYIWLSVILVIAL